MVIRLDEKHPFNALYAHKWDVARPGSEKTALHPEKNLFLGLGPILPIFISLFSSRITPKRLYENIPNLSLK